MICCMCGSEAYVKLGELFFCSSCLKEQLNSYCPYVSMFIDNKIYKKAVAK